MVDLSCKYLGLELRNPIIVSSSGLTGDLSKIIQLYQNGAGAIVLKSLFEEHICAECIDSGEFQPEPDSLEWVTQEARDYIEFVKEVKKSVPIPVIASISCVSTGSWVNFVKNIEDAGADAIEINIFFFPTDKDFRADDYERIFLDTITKIGFQISIPISVKLSQSFTNILYIIDQLYYRGVQGVVLFNRNFAPDIDIVELELIPASLYSNANELNYALRYTALVSLQVPKIDIAASSGVHNPDAAIKLLLAGANAVMVCSVLYSKGIDYLSEIIQGLTSWMEEKGFEKIEHIHKQLNYEQVSDPFQYEREGFIKNFK